MKLCSVREKIPCIFKSVVRYNDESNKDVKKPRQSFSVEASEVLVEDFIKHLDRCDFVATEKVDGTSVLIKPFNGKPWLWARHDRKLTKQAEKRLKKLENTAINEMLNRSTPIAFDESDFKPAPENWEPSESCIDAETKMLMPDTNGHIMGWVPVCAGSRQYCWHLETVDLENGLALVLQPDTENDVYTSLKLGILPLSSMLGATYELVGTNVNNNPYGLGSKRSPFHFLVRHGALRVQTPESVGHKDFVDWFQNASCGRAEGIVWHFSDEKMFKLHRHHLKLRWPMTNPRLASVPVEMENFGQPLSKHISKLIALDQKSFSNLLSLSQALEDI